MPTIHVTDVYGKQHTIEAAAGVKLMEILRQYEFGVAAACGGNCSCATCHVYVDPAWMARLPERQSDEEDVLLSISTYDKSTSRLSCQVRFTAALDGIQLTIAPEE
jgi:2Fe-2S ferredoxin